LIKKENKKNDHLIENQGLLKKSFFVIFVI